MKHYLLLFFLLPGFCFAQESASIERPFSIGVNYSPNYSFRHLDSNSEAEGLVNYRDDIEEPAFGFHVGLGAQYRFAKKFELVLNLQYAEHTFAAHGIKLLSGNGLITGSLDQDYTFEYIEVPLRANYYLLDKQVFGYLTLGGNVGFYQGYNIDIQVTYPDGQTEDFESGDNLDLSRATLGLVGGFGIGTNAGQRFQFRLEPLFRYMLTPIADAPVKQRHYSFGGQFGIYFKI